MKRIVTVLLVLSAGGFFAATPGLATQAIPQDSGFSGFINLGIGVTSAGSNMIAGNRLADIGKSRIDSLTDSPDSEA
jgi:hypothetical protein